MNTRRITHIGLIGLISLICLISLIGLIAFTRSRPEKDLSSFVQSGSLVLNTERSYYIPGEDIYIQITSLDNNGIVLCNSDLELVAVNPQISNTKYQIPISKSPTCNPSGINSNSPDYYAYFKPESDGTYKLTLSDKDGGNSVETQISVGEYTSDLSVSRWGPTRLTLNGSNRYPMIITVSAGSDFEGTISDKLPRDFNFAWFGSAQVKEETISWNIDLNAGETKELKYEYIPSADQASATIGPISISSGGTTQEIGNEWNLVLQMMK